MPHYDINVPPPKHNPDKDSLRRIGQAVRERLAALPEVYKLPTDKAELWAVGKFFTPEECGRLTTMAGDCGPRQTRARVRLSTCRCTVAKGPDTKRQRRSART